MSQSYSNFSGLNNEAIFNLTLIQIYRLSFKNLGSFYNTKGIDEFGNASNLVEIETIIINQNKQDIYSIVQLQSSVPLNFRQGGRRENVKVDEKQDDKLLKQFYLSLHEQYNKILNINFLSQLDMEENKLYDQLKQNLKLLQLEFLRYEQFEYKDSKIIKQQDFHESLEHLIAKMNNYSKTNQAVGLNFQYFKQNQNTQEVLKKQQGVLYVTNLKSQYGSQIFGNKVIGHWIEYILNDIGVQLIFPFMDYMDALCADDFFDKYREVIKINSFNFSQVTWNLNSSKTHFRSQRISDTAQITNFYKDRKHLKIFFNNSIADIMVDSAYKIIQQNKIDLVQRKQESQQLQQKIIEKQRELLKTEQIKVAIITWNINAYTPEKKQDLNKIFDWQGQDNPDFVVFCTQEVVKLQFKNMINERNEDVLNRWISTILFNLNRQKYVYKYIECQELVGLFIAIFVKQSVSHRIQRVDTDLIRTGLGGNLGNKGGIVIRVKYQDKKISFINCHLPAGDKYVQDRVDTFKFIYQQAFQQDTTPKNQFESLSKSTVSFLIGDLNFRVGIKYQEMLGLIKQYREYQNQPNKKSEQFKLLIQMLNEDQLLKVLKKKESVISNFIEGPISFLPTYKFDNGTHTYDTSKKRRVPSWCDRILISGSDKLLTFKQIYYRSNMEYKLSDHMPVSSYYVLEFEEYLENECIEQDKKLYHYFFDDDQTSNYQSIDYKCRNQSLNLQKQQQLKHQDQDSLFTRVSEITDSNIENSLFLSQNISQTQNNNQIDKNGKNLQFYRGNFSKQGNLQNQQQTKNQKYQTINDIVQETNNQIHKSEINRQTFQIQQLESNTKDQIKKPVDAYKLYNNYSINKNVQYFNYD